MRILLLFFLPLGFLTATAPRVGILSDPDYVVLADQVTVALSSQNTEGYKWNLMFILWQGADLDRESAAHIYPPLREY